jgi:hypothetical protein
VHCGKLVHSTGLNRAQLYLGNDWTRHLHIARNSIRNNFPTTRDSSRRWSISTPCQPLSCLVSSVGVKQRLRAPYTTYMLHACPDHYQDKRSCSAHATKVGQGKQVPGPSPSWPITVLAHHRSQSNCRSQIVLRITRVLCRFVFALSQATILLSRLQRLHSHTEHQKQSFNNG